jgi:hypothetical protein
MAHRQAWPLSQDAHKSSGVCSSCHAVRQLHIKNGTIHRHGPRSNPCSGSDKPPLSAHSSSFQFVSTTPLTAGASRSPPEFSDASSNVIASSISSTANKGAVFTHPLVVGGLIKHIPKSARTACGALLTKLLHGVTINPLGLEPWYDLLHFGVRILQKPARTGIRHNLASIIKKRTEEIGPLVVRQPANRFPVAYAREGKPMNYFLPQSLPRLKMATSKRRSEY